LGVILLFDADPGSGIEKVGPGIRDGKNSDPGSGINIPDPQNRAHVPEPIRYLYSVLLESGSGTISIIELKLLAKINSNCLVLIENTEDKRKLWKLFFGIYVFGMAFICHIQFFEFICS
jgi:hypothetical protein